MDYFYRTSYPTVKNTLKGPLLDTTFGTVSFLWNNALANEGVRPLDLLTVERCVPFSSHPV